MKVYLVPQESARQRLLAEVNTLVEAQRIVEGIDKEWEDCSDFDNLPEDSVLRVYEGSDIEVHDNGGMIWWLGDDEWLDSQSQAVVPWS